MIGIIGDLHLKEKLGYSDYIQDKREAEKKGAFDCIYNEFKDCDDIVFLGDQLNSRNNTSEVIKELVSFVERFGDKEIYMIAGNHEKKGDGRSAIDFMRETNKKNWHIITTTTEKHNLHGIESVFLPYFHCSELGVDDKEEGISKTLAELEKIGKADVLFHHFAVSGTKTSTGTSTSIFDEIVLPKEKVSKMYKMVIGGHVHKPQMDGNVLVAGSIFTNEVGEDEKFVYKLDDKIEVSKKKLPLRGIHKLTDPTQKDIDEIKKGDIVKVELTVKQTEAKKTKLKEMLEEKFDTYVLLENYPSEREKIDFDSSDLDFTVEAMLKKFSEINKINADDLINAFNEIK